MASKTIKGKIIEILSQSVNDVRTSEKIMKLVDDFAFDFAKFTWGDFYDESERGYPQVDKKKLLHEFKIKQYKNENQIKDLKKRSKAVQSPKDNAGEYPTFTRNNGFSQESKSE